MRSGACPLSDCGAYDDRRHGACWTDRHPDVCWKSGENGSGVCDDQSPCYGSDSDAVAPVNPDDGLSATDSFDAADIHAATGFFA